MVVQTRRWNSVDLRSMLPAVTTLPRSEGRGSSLSNYPSNLCCFPGGISVISVFLLISSESVKWTALSLLFQHHFSWLNYPMWYTSVGVSLPCPWYEGYSLPCTDQELCLLCSEESTPIKLLLSVWRWLLQWQFRAGEWFSVSISPLKKVCFFSF